MTRIVLAVSIWLLAAMAAFAAEARLVVLGVARAGYIEFFDAWSLETEGTLHVNQLAESVNASPDGRTLYLAQESPATPGGCCGLYSLNLETAEMCLLAESAMFGVPSADGRLLFTQRGNRGIEVIDAANRSRNTEILAMSKSAYAVHPSPDGRWLCGLTNSPKPAVDVFETGEQLRPRRHLELPTGPATGAWVGDEFYMFAYGDRGKGQLWHVNGESRSLPEATLVALPDLHGACDEPVLLMMAGTSGRLFLAEAFGFKLDRRRACGNLGNGGIYAIQPQSGQATRIAEPIHINRMVASPDGRDLYVIHSDGPGEHSARRLLRLDAATGHVRAQAALEPGVWNLALARVPTALIPHGSRRAAGCSRY